MSVGPRSAQGIRIPAFIGLGANLGDARATLDAAFVAIAQLPRTELRAASSIYASAPLDSSGPDYLNAVILVDTGLSPTVLLMELQRIELAHGRERPYRNAPRTLDLDLLLYGDRQIDSSNLAVPHPRLHERAFVLLPLAEIDGAFPIPGRGQVRDWLASVADQRVDKL
jgi:2-amino-4-hydroxy-6-hydroxymethyldihydropteridine diphosphokinase